MPEKDYNISQQFSANEFNNIKKYLSTESLINEAEILQDFLENLSNIKFGFSRSDFARVRPIVGPQSMWGTMAGVAQGTIGNWERGITSPDSYYRRKLIKACEYFILEYKGIASSRQLEKTLIIDPIETKIKLNKSILRAALTDFDFDPKNGKIIPIPFSEDNSTNIEAIEEDRKNLINSLCTQAKIISDDLNTNSNSTASKLKKFFDRYGSEAEKSQPNPRLLNNFGEVIRRSLNDEFIRDSISSFDLISTEQFNNDHLELMRLYFRSALARAQEIQMISIDENSSIPSSQPFYEVAETIRQAQQDQDQPFIDNDIPTLLIDIGNEIDEIEEAEKYTFNTNLRDSLKRRRIQAVKTGAVYVGRFVFFTSLFVVLTPSIPAVSAGGLASIVTVMEALAPGSVRGSYEKLREYLPILPKLPTLEK